MVVGSSSHGGERKRQLGLAITISVSGTHLQIRLGPHNKGRSVGSESAPHFNIGSCGRGFELSWRRKKKTIGTCHNSICEWDPPSDKVGTPQ